VEVEILCHGVSNKKNQVSLIWYGSRPSSPVSLRKNKKCCLAPCIHTPKLNYSGRHIYAICNSSKCMHAQTIKLRLYSELLILNVTLWSKWTNSANNFVTNERANSTQKLWRTGYMKSTHNGYTWQYDYKKLTGATECSSNRGCTYASLLSSKYLWHKDKNNNRQTPRLCIGYS
jgi:hypothetical protein